MTDMHRSQLHKFEAEETISQYNITFKNCILKKKRKKWENYQNIDSFSCELKNSVQLSCYMFIHVKPSDSLVRKK